MPGPLASMATRPRARETLTHALQTKSEQPRGLCRVLPRSSRDVSQRIGGYGSLEKVPAATSEPAQRHVSGARSDAASRPRTRMQRQRPSLRTRAQVDQRLSDQPRTGHAPHPALGEDHRRAWRSASARWSAGSASSSPWVRRIGKTHLTYCAWAPSAELGRRRHDLRRRALRPAGLDHAYPHLRGVAGAAVRQNGAGLRARTIAGRGARRRSGPSRPRCSLAGGLYWLMLTLLDTFATR